MKLVSESRNFSGFVTEKPSKFRTESLIVDIVKLWSGPKRSVDPSWYLN